jgi:ABC-type glycerol-3-phosphate transport system substrate-binding protein
MWRSGEILRSIAFGAWETAASLPISSHGNLPCALLPGGYFAVCLPDSVQVRNTDPQYLPERPLKLNGAQWEELTRQFAKSNPDVPIAYSDEYFMSMEEMAANMTGPGAADVYTIYSGNIDLGELYKKGYLADLSGNRAIEEIVDRMYPNVREALMYDGKIIAVPYDTYAYTFGINLKTLEEIGLTPDDAPKTYYELLEFIEKWIREYSADYPDLKLFEYSEYLNNQLINAILNAQNSYCGVQSEPLTFDTPVIRKLLAKLESIDFTPLSENVSFDDDGNSRNRVIVYSMDGSDEGSAPLFEMHSQVSVNRYGGYSMWEYEPMPLSLDEGMPAIIDAHMNMLILNQKSSGSEEAMRFMQYYAENMYPAMRINTMPDENEPIENTYYAQSLEHYQEQLGIDRKSVV